MKKIAILILSHDDLPHLIRLINQFNKNMFDIYIHIDKKSKLSNEKIYDKISRHNNVFLVDDRIKVYWGGYSIVKAELKLIQEAVSHREYLSFILISGSDYLIKRSEDLYHKIIIENRDYINSINLFELPKSNKLRKSVTHRNKFDYLVLNNTSAFIFKLNRKLINLVLNRIPLKNDLYDGKFSIFQGSQWWVLTNNSIRKIMSEYQDHQKKYDKLFSKIFAPDEKFFHSIYYNVIHPESRVEKPIQYINESDYDKQTALLANLTYLNHSLKGWFTETDYDEIIKSKYFFVRKVSTENSSQLLSMIDEYLKEKENE